jgi:thiamine phosphate synthase YjbQ (UPF0047 family)
MALRDVGPVDSTTGGPLHANTYDPAGAMTSVEVPYSVACALPSLVVLDITNEVAHEVAQAECSSGIAFLTADEDGLIRVNEREAGFFADVEELLARLVALDVSGRERLLAFLLGARTEQLPFANGELCLGRWQRILLFGFGEYVAPEWSLTIVG